MNILFIFFANCLQRNAYKNENNKYGKIDKE